MHLLGTSVLVVSIFVLKQPWIYYRLECKVYMSLSYNKKPKDSVLFVAGCFGFKSQIPGVLRFLLQKSGVLWLGLFEKHCFRWDL